MDKPLSKEIKVFISYSHKDAALREELTNHLSSLIRHMKITAWNDQHIAPGTEWRRQIEDKLNSAQIVLLLVSSDFLASDYCYDIEMKQAIARLTEGTAQIIPIILRPCYFQGSPLGKLQVLPKNGKAVTQWDNRDSAFLDIVNGIQQVANSLKCQEYARVVKQRLDSDYDRHGHMTNETRQALTQMREELLLSVEIAGNTIRSILQRKESEKEERLRQEEQERLQKERERFLQKQRYFEEYRRLMRKHIILGKKQRIRLSGLRHHCGLNQTIASTLEKKYTWKDNLMHYSRQLQSYARDNRAISVASLSILLILVAGSMSITHNTSTQQERFDNGLSGQLGRLSLSEEEALQTVKQYLERKSEFFGENRGSVDASLAVARQLMHGKRYERTEYKVRELQGDEYLSFEDPTVSAIGFFCSLEQGKAEIHLAIDQPYTQHVAGLLPEPSESEQKFNGAFALQYVDGSWKVADIANTAASGKLLTLRKDFWGEDRISLLEEQCN